MSDRDPTLVALGAACGIAESYWDARGQLHHPSEATLRHLLAEMRVLERRDAAVPDIAAALERERAAPWRRTLAPVRVLYEGETSGIEVVVADDALETPLGWRIEREDGERVVGGALPAELNMAGVEGGGAGDSRGSRDGRPMQLRWLALPALPLGYHALSLDSTADDGSAGTIARARLIVAPRRCQEGATRRSWGPAAQLYAMRSARNAGTGDFADLAALAATFGAMGAGLVGINPLHALFAHEPESASPYSPSSRLFLNPLYLALEHVPGFADLASEDKPATAELERLRDADLVDYTAVLALKSGTLEALHRRFIAASDAETRAARADFTDWRRELGEPLERFALFEALRERNAADGDEATTAWWDWPDGLDDPTSPASLAARDELAARIDHHAWLQWLCTRQLEDAAQAAREAGMAVGLYRDLAVGTAAGGSDAWAAQPAYLTGVEVGAPPDDFSAQGQGWGLPALDPRTLRELGFEPFAAMLRANMHASGAIRIDHVMGLARLFWIPVGSPPTEGAYVAYPLDEMLAVLALESRRAGCIVIGEDLGTVPEGFRERLNDAGVLAYRLLYFEKDYGGDLHYLAPTDYPPQSLVGANTHDLPTLRGWWASSDIDLRAALDLMPSDTFERAQRAERDADRRRLLEALAHAGLLPEGIEASDPQRVTMDPPLVDAIHAFIAHAGSALMVANLEDMVGQLEQMNLPGTDRDLYPNWRRRLPVALEAIATDAGVRSAASAIKAER